MYYQYVTVFFSHPTEVKKSPRVAEIRVGGGAKRQAKKPGGALIGDSGILLMAGVTGLEPAASGVTGLRQSPAP